MQSKAGRFALVGAALVVAVVAFLLLRPSDDGGGTESPTPAAEEASVDGGGKSAAAGNEDGPSGPVKQRPAPEATEVEVEDGAPVGGVAEVSVEKGDEVTLLVRADGEDHVHVHGYDQFADVAPGKPAKLEFPADIEGIFEIELEDSHTQIARLEVTP